MFSTYIFTVFHALTHFVVNVNTFLGILVLELKGFFNSHAKHFVVDNIRHFLHNGAATNQNVLRFNRDKSIFVCDYLLLLCYLLFMIVSISFGTCEDRSLNRA